MVLVAGAAWIGLTVPSREDADLRPILRPTHHSWQGQPHLLWVSEPPPPEFRPIRAIEPSPDERAMQCLSFGGWASFAVQPLAQWRWEHERESVLAEDEVRHRLEADRRARVAREREEYLSGVSLRQLAARRFFPRWDRGLSRKLVSESRDIMRRTVRALLDLGDAAPEQERMDLLRACIEAFNELDAKHEFIETTEREDICEEFEAIVRACGLEQHVNLADEWRDW